MLDGAGGQPIVCIVDDDGGVRDGLDSLLRSFGMQPHDSLYELLADARHEAAERVLVDDRLPGRSGIDFLADMADRRFASPRSCG